MKNFLFLVSTLTSLAVFSANVHGQTKKNSNLKKFPAGYSPVEVGNRVARRFISLPYSNFGKPAPAKYITYTETCTWLGALNFADLTKNKNMVVQLAERFEPLFNEKRSFLPEPDHVDYTVFGAVPLELFMQTKENRYLELGKAYADTQWAKPYGPRVTPASYTYYDKGLSWQTRMWIDDMYMITAVQAQASLATGDPVYIERAAKEMVVYLDSLQKPNGLFYHAPDVPFFWGRGNGWMAVGMSDLLRFLPRSNSNYKRFMQGFTLMMQSLYKHQSEEGMWRQLVDDKASWAETSATGMFTFAFITGVKNGWLPKKKFGPAARKGWLALVSYIDENGDVRDVCEGTNKKNSREWYLNRRRLTGDNHGQAPILWCASALLETQQ